VSRGWVFNPTPAFCFCGVFIEKNMDETNVVKIAVYNSDAGRKYDLYVRKDRCLAFHKFLMDRRWRGEYQPAAPGMPGLSWAAFMGLDAIFDRRPKSFPVRDILQWIANDIIPGGGAPAVTPHEVESALEKFSAVYPPDVSENA
jgi:hypothetical protein